MLNSLETSAVEMDLASALRSFVIKKYIVLTGTRNIFDFSKILKISRSDENQCGSMVVYPSDHKYGINYPPTKRIIGYLNTSFPLLDIKLQISMQKIFDINPSTSTFSMIFTLVLEWHDLNLVFHFLKKDKLLNSLVRNWQNIWKPQLQFSILSGTQEFPKILNEEMLVTRMSEPALSNDVDKLFHYETFNGDKNSIYWKQTLQGSFVCDFGGIAMYPVGSNLCEVKLYLGGIANKMTKFSEISIDNIQESTVGEFMIRNINFSITNNGDMMNIINLEIEMQRSIFSIFMVTYIPTILMNMINQVYFLTPPTRTYITMIGNSLSEKK